MASSEKGWAKTEGRHKVNMGYLFKQLLCQGKIWSLLKGPEASSIAIIPKHSSPKRSQRGGGGLQEDARDTQSPTVALEKKERKKPSQDHFLGLGTCSVFFLQNDFSRPQPQTTLSPGICLCPSPQPSMPSPSSEVISSQTIRI